MLIRSQDKKCIKPIELCNEIYVLDSMVFINGREFGEYSTEEKAIKVLDMIMEHYDKVMDARYWKDEYQENYFIMPSDEEVEV